MARDCTQNKDPNAVGLAGPSPPQGGRFDSEYANLMAELGETPAGAAVGGGPQAWSAPADITGGGSSIPPWRRPESWQAPNNQQQQNNGYRPPQPGYGGYGGAQGYGGAPGAAWAGYQQGSGYPQQQSQDYNYASYYQGQYAQQQA
jgi:splicing factor 1